MVASAGSCFTDQPSSAASPQASHWAWPGPSADKDLDGAGCSRVASSHSTRFSRLSGHFLLWCALALIHAPVIR
jgi:hypothetical protein